MALRTPMPARAQPRGGCATSPNAKMNLVVQASCLDRGSHSGGIRAPGVQIRRRKGAPPNRNFPPEATRSFRMNTKSSNSVKIGGSKSQIESSVKSREPRADLQSSTVDGRSVCVGGHRERAKANL